MASRMPNAIAITDSARSCAAQEIHLWAAEPKLLEIPSAIPSFRGIFGKDPKDLRSISLCPSLNIGGFSDLTTAANRRRAVQDVVPAIVAPLPPFIFG